MRTFLKYYVAASIAGLVAERIHRVTGWPYLTGQSDYVIGCIMGIYIGRHVFGCAAPKKPAR